MNKLRWSGVAVIAGLLVVVAIWWVTSEDQKDELNKSDALDGQGTKLKGNFIEATIGLDLSFWMVDKRLRFKAVTEQEYKQSYEEFKLKVQNRNKE